MKELSKSFPEGSSTRSSTTRPSSSSSRVDAVIETIGEAIVLVVLVVILFLQTWRAAVIPHFLPSRSRCIGTFFFMALFGFSLNNLSLFGLVLAIGIVVDDAIVVVENVERNIAEGLPPLECRTPHHGRGRRGADRHRTGTLRRVRSVGLHHRHLGRVLSAIRAHHRRRDRHLAARVR